IAAGIGLVVFVLAVFVFGRGEQMAPLDPRTSPAELPESDITSQDVGKIRFAVALRGYRMSDVDWALERLGDQLDVLRLENAQLRAFTPGSPGAHGVGAQLRSADVAGAHSADVADVHSADVADGLGHPPRGAVPSLLKSYAAAGVGALPVSADGPSVIDAGGVDSRGSESDSSSAER
ncbi:MAG: DivIVA domain-containing protein, partial [Nakamurella sp.]